MRSLKLVQRAQMSKEKYKKIIKIIRNWSHFDFDQIHNSNWCWLLTKTNPLLSCFFTARSWILLQKTRHSRLGWLQLQMVILLHLILDMPVFYNSVTNKNSSVVFRKVFSFNSFVFVGFSFLITCLQGHFKFLPHVFTYIGAHWYHHPLQHRVELWWPCFNAIWVVYGFCFHHARFTVNGWNLFILSNCWWSLLLEC